MKPNPVVPPGLQPKTGAPAKATVPSWKRRAIEAGAKDAFESASQEGDFEYGPDGKFFQTKVSSAGIDETDNAVIFSVKMIGLSGAQKGHQYVAKGDLLVDWKAKQVKKFAKEFADALGLAFAFDTLDELGKAITEAKPNVMISAETKPTKSTGRPFQKVTVHKVEPVEVEKPEAPTDYEFPAVGADVTHNSADIGERVGKVVSLRPESGEVLVRFPKSRAKEVIPVGELVWSTAA
jgi:hypothetical protein